MTHRSRKRDTLINKRRQNHDPNQAIEQHKDRNTGLKKSS